MSKVPLLLRSSPAQGTGSYGALPVQMLSTSNESSADEGMHDLDHAIRSGKRKAASHLREADTIAEDEPESSKSVRSRFASTGRLLNRNKGSRRSRRKSLPNFNLPDEHPTAVEAWVGNLDEEMESDEDMHSDSGRSDSARSDNSEAIDIDGYEGSSEAGEGAQSKAPEESPSDDSPYPQVIVEQSMFYNQKLTITYQILLTISTQVLGYALAGLTRRFLVRPSGMIWPGTLISTSMFSTLHKQDNAPANGWHISRMRFFLYIFLGSAAFYFLPGLLFPALSYFNVITWFAPKNVVVANLFGVASGLGLFPMTFDWSQIAYIGSPLVVPFWAALNIVGGLVVVMWFMAPIMYYMNVMYSSYMPILSAAVFDNTGKPYDVSKILTDNFLFDEKSYENYSRVFLPITYPIHLPWYGLLLALGICTLLFIPIGIVMAITNQQSSLYLICQLICGVVFPGRPVANMVFVTYGYITSTQGLKFSSDLKLGHYMKIPPRILFTLQLAATLVSSLTQIGVLNWMLQNIPGICTPEAINGFNCPIARVHFNGSILAWWKKYTMTLSAALDSGVAVGVVIVFFGVIYPGFNKGFSWWGTEVFKQGCDWHACSYKTVEPGDYFGPDTW
ncbi:putative sexual differentiation process protein isp4 [Diplodia seriata]|uniref:Putative sexual differentiation process protein isp4 n=1 Tax=Diplodia seriata TaxID=420778 RepID=A0A0G2EYY1_9PEZI|nr:putative sexual differentiation process protein isp4 [Diplodia seriata]